jgi:site-specific recombinase XerD
VLQTNVGRRFDENWRKLTTTPLPQPNAYAMIRRRASAAGIATKVGNHSFRATGITAYLKNGETLEKAASMANHASTRTTQLYDRITRVALPAC